MSDTVQVAAVGSLTSMAVLFITLAFQARRDSIAYARSQREAKLQRLRNIYRVAMKGAQVIQVVALDAGNPLMPGETLQGREVQLYRDFRAGIDTLNEAWVDLTLENASTTALDFTPKIIRAYAQFQAKLHEAHPDGSVVSTEEMEALAGELFALMRQQAAAMQAHLAEIETPPAPGHWWDRRKKPRA